MKLSNRARTVAALIRHFATREKAFLLPLLLVLLASGILLLLTQGIAHVAPFVYTLF